MSLKQKKIKFRPRITKDKIEPQHIFQFILLDFSMERGLGGGGRIVVVVVTKRIKQLIDKGYFNELFL